MNILGVSCYYHDAAAALIKDGQLVAAAEEERFSRKKHDSDFPRLSIDFCLRQGGIRAGDLDYVVFYDKPILKFERILTTTIQAFPRSWGSFREGMTTWLLDKLWIKSTLRDQLKIEPSRVLFARHHTSHAASSYYCSPFDKSAILTVDGVGEWATAGIGIGEGRTITMKKEMRFPHSLGLLYSAFTAYLGFEVNEGEYKVMGMAPYGQPKYVDRVYRLMDLAEDGSFRLDLDYFSYHHSTSRMFNHKFEELFGPPRPLQDRDKLDLHYADIAASIQRVCEEVLLKMARHAYEETGLTRLCMAGGVALNSVANGRILRETPFEELYIVPAAGDGGGAVGAALYGYHQLLGHPRSFVMSHAYWGEEHSQGAIEDFLQQENIAHTSFEEECQLIEQVTEHLVDGRVIGWLNGRFEYGPRALGARSILADPRRAEMKDIVNAKIKFREAFRPFAPSVLMEHSDRYFDLAEPGRHYPARFMLLIVPVHEAKREVLPAITHVDGTARMQTVDATDSPRYYRLIHSFGQATGVPVVLNTSFNLRGEPIVNTPAEAFSTFARSEMDYLVLGNSLVGKAKL